MEINGIYTSEVSIIISGLQFASKKKRKCFLLERCLHFRGVLVVIVPI